MASSGPDIVVVAILTFGGGGGGGSGGGGGGGGEGEHENELEPEPEGPTYEDFYRLTHTEKCSTKDGAAQQVKDKIVSTANVYGPTPFNWTRAEYVSLLVQTGDGLWGAANDQVLTKGDIRTSSFPRPNDTDIVAGIVHNHPVDPSRGVTYELTRYPSHGDWVALAEIQQRNSNGNPNYDPSLWIIDSRGDVREFRASERNQFDYDAVDQDDMSLGVGLQGRERTGGCPDAH